MLKLSGYYQGQRKWRSEVSIRIYAGSDISRFIHFIAFNDFDSYLEDNINLYKTVLYTKFVDCMKI
ncbi:hypothetical protein ES703_30405 [subsurface metagenome]